VHSIFNVTYSVQTSHTNLNTDKNCAQYILR